MKVVVAMSGGVDSSVAAYLLREAGHEVTGATLRVCDREEHLAAATAAARRLGIPLDVIDLRELFQREVIDAFCREYLRGRTPNPCVRCNRYIKFGALLDMALEKGADYLATGHYARIERQTGDGCLLKRGSDPDRDQSYFLYALTAEQLSRAMFPVGHLTKRRVREIAAGLGMAAERAESREICFIPDGDYAAFLREAAPQAARPGPITDRPGRLLGQHRGIAAYTIGQRRGLGIAAPEPLYVTGIEPENDTVIVGSREDIYARELTAADLNWLKPLPLDKPRRVQAAIRYRHRAAEAFINNTDNGNLYVRFTEPQMAITPGQSVVFYDGDTVLGGGIIQREGGEACLQ